MSTTGKLPVGKMRFFDNYIPTLEVGDYIINVSQRVNPKNSDVDECFSISQPFSVLGPRYTLPAGDLHSVFPRRQSIAIVDQTLPHLVLTQRDLPWERDIFNDRTTSSQTPWMALLLLVPSQNEILDPSTPHYEANPARVGVVTSYDLYHHGDDPALLWPALEREWYESDEALKVTPVSVIDLPPASFVDFVPKPADLKYLAHVRQVASKGPEVHPSEGWFSVLLGARLPTLPPEGVAGLPHIVHLVSLEGYEDYVRGKPFDASVQRVRMISLASWTFTSHAAGAESFSELMNGMLANPRKLTEPLGFRLPLPTLPVAPTPAMTYSWEALGRGYVPLGWATRLGEQGFAWYRGPFAPVPVENFVERLWDGEDWRPFGTASAAAVYDRHQGMFDHSYSAAWETGRLMALSDGSFGRALLEWRRRGHALLDLILERTQQIAAFRLLSDVDARVAAPVDEQSLLALLESYAVTDDYMTRLAREFATAIVPSAPGAGAPNPTRTMLAYADAPAPPALPTMLKELTELPSVKAVLRSKGVQGLELITAWLARAYLLMGVPFSALLPRAELLPPESLRFFYIDSNWLDVLLEGALSIGIESSRDSMYQNLMKEVIWDGTMRAIEELRDRQLGDWAHKTDSGGVPFDKEKLTGMLLRSAVVAGWPGLEVQAYTSDAMNPGPDPATEIGLLHMTRLAENVLLCIFPAVPALVTISEPKEGIESGFQDPPRGEGDFLRLRSLGDKDYGMPLTELPTFDAAPCIDARRRLEISGLLSGLKAKLPGTPNLSVTDFTVQMTRVPEQAVFKFQSKGAR
jgi:hypothetical protein